MNTVVHIWENDGNGTPLHKCFSIGFMVRGFNESEFFITPYEELNCGRELVRGKRWLKLLGNAYQYDKFIPQSSTKFANGYEMDVKVALELLRDLAELNVYTNEDEFDLYEKFKAKKLTAEDLGWTEEYARPATTEQIDNPNQLNLFE